MPCQVVNPALPLQLSHDGVDEREAGTSLQRETERDGDRKRETETERDTQRQTQTQREREKKTEMDEDMGSYIFTISIS